MGDSKGKQYGDFLKEYEAKTIAAGKKPDIMEANELFRKSLAAKDNNFFGHSKVNKQNIVKNPPKQVPQLGKDGFYSNVKNRTGQL